MWANEADQAMKELKRVRIHSIFVPHSKTASFEVAYDHYCVLVASNDSNMIAQIGLAMAFGGTFPRFSSTAENVTKIEAAVKEHSKQRPRLRIYQLSIVRKID